MTSVMSAGVSYDIHVDGTIHSKNMSIIIESSKVIVYQIITNTYGNKYRVTEKIVFKGVGVIKDETYTLIECNQDGLPLKMVDLGTTQLAVLL